MTREELQQIIDKSGWLFCNDTISEILFKPNSFDNMVVHGKSPKLGTSGPLIYDCIHENFIHQWREATPEEVNKYVNP